MVGISRVWVPTATGQAAATSWFITTAVAKNHNDLPNLISRLAFLKPGVYEKSTLKKLLFALLILPISLFASALTSVNENDLDHYWKGRSGAGVLSPALQRMNQAMFSAMRKHGTVYVTMDFTINVDGSVSDVVVSKIEPAEVDPKPFAAIQSSFKYDPVDGTTPVPVRVHVSRRPNWIPQQSP